MLWISYSFSIRLTFIKPVVKCTYELTVNIIKGCSFEPQARKKRQQQKIRCPFRIINI